MLQLHRWDVLPAIGAAGTPAVRSATFSDREHDVVVPIEPRHASAHGITDALRDAELLARAIANGGATALRDYEATRLELSRALFEITDDVASFAWTDSEVQALHRTFSAKMSREVRALAALEPFLGGASIGQSRGLSGSARVMAARSA